MRTVEEIAGLGVVNRQFAEQARQMLARAISGAVVIRQPCEVSGETPAEAHHYDYARPLEVIWLRKKEHDAVHKLAIHDPPRIRDRPVPIIEGPIQLVPMGNEIEMLRHRLGISTDALASAAGLSNRSHLRRIEREVIDPQASTLRRIVDALEELSE